MIEALGTVIAAIGVAFFAALAYYRDRRLRQLGLVGLLYAEIEQDRKGTERSFKDPQWATSVKSIIRNGQDPYVSVVPARNRLFDSVHNEMYLLLGWLTAKLVDHYELDRHFSLALSRLGSKDFSMISQKRKCDHIDTLEGLLNLYRQATSEALEALRQYQSERTDAPAYRDLFCGVQH